MTHTIASLARRIEALEDIEAIRQLKARYLRACDLKQAEDVRACFAPGEVRIAYQNFPVFTNRDDFVDVFVSMACAPGVYDLHHGTNAEIDLLSTIEAQGLWALNFRTILLSDRQVISLGLEYKDTYRKEGGRWWIARTATRITSMLTERIAPDGTSRYVSLGEASHFAV